MVSDCTGMGCHLPNIISSHMEPIAESITDRIGVLSIEDALSQVEAFNEEKVDSQEPMVLI